MLRLESTTGSIELSAEQERGLRSMSDAAVCRALNRGGDPFLFAALKERPQIHLHPSAGWVYYPEPVSLPSFGESAS
jgi:hypothetical protein